MNQILEIKLRDLIEEANRQASPAILTVLRLLMSAYQNGRQNDFAKHCCKYSPVAITGAAIKTNQEGEDGWPSDGSKTYVN